MKQNSDSNFFNIVKLAFYDENDFLSPTKILIFFAATGVTAYGVSKIYNENFRKEGVREFSFFLQNTQDSREDFGENQNLECHRELNRQADNSELEPRGPGYNS